MLLSSFCAVEAAEHLWPWLSEHSLFPFPLCPPVPEALPRSQESSPENAKPERFLVQSLAGGGRWEPQKAKEDWKM